MHQCQHCAKVDQEAMDRAITRMRDDEATAEWVRDLQGTATDRYAVPPLEDDPTAQMLGNGHRDQPNPSAS